MYAAILALAPWVLYSQLALWTPAGAPDKKMAAVGVAASVLLLYASLVSAFFVAGTWSAVFILAWLERKVHPKKWRWVLGLSALILLGYLPWVGVIWRQSLALKAGVWTGMVIDQPRELLKFALENLWFHAWKLGWGFAVMSKLARLLMPLALLNLWDAKARPRHGLMLLGFTLTFLLYFGLTWHKPFHTGRYFSAWWPWAIYFLAAAFSGLETALRKLEFPWPRAAAVLALVFGGFYLNLQFQNLHYYFSDFEKENYRAAVKHLKTTVSPDARWVATGPWQKNCFRYYGAPDNFFLRSNLTARGRQPDFFMSDCVRRKTNCCWRALV